MIWKSCENDYPDYRPVEKDMPQFLYYYGKKPHGRCFGIVGTRRADYNGLVAAYKLGLECGVNGISVVSGIAEGCDQAALLGCLSAGFPCYAVLGCGLGVDYPALTKNLKSRIIDSGGAVISKFEMFMPPLKQNFPDRNLTISAMSECVVAVQCPSKSGTLITTDFALQMGKDVFVSTAGLGEKYCRRGTEKLAMEGAYVIESISELDNMKYQAVRTKFDANSKYRFADVCFRIVTKGTL